MVLSQNGMVSSLSCIGFAGVQLRVDKAWGKMGELPVPFTSLPHIADRSLYVSLFVVINLWITPSASGE